ncbi:hypothetical protein F5Y10DRAFT_252513 [Nemania abortiva]|nr:hypothetical protein F5Y10DRAFT_252513 [Nemania abortiva]
MQPTVPPDRTLRRRAQNASAQRTYRAKQKQRLQRLEALSIAALASSSSPSSSSSTLGRRGAFDTSRRHESLGPALPPPLLPAGGQPGRGGPSTTTSTTTTTVTTTLPLDNRLVHAPDVRSLNLGLVQALLRSCTPRERQTFHIILMRERFSLRDIIKYGLIQLGYAMNASLFESAKHASTRAWIAQVLSAMGEIDIPAVFAAGIRLLASFPLPESLLASGNNNNNDDDDDDEVIRRVVFAPQAMSPSNRITLSTVSLGSAFFANAMLLGIPLAAMAQDDDVPMHPQALRCTKPDLAPTPAQRAIPHHPSLDVIPWPVFRTNVCVAIAHDPPLVDDDELCLDLLNEGVRCWGSGAGDSLHGRGQGAPWDSRSWEAAPWFLEKWEALTGGRDGDMWRGSEWWRAMRS